MILSMTGFGRGTAVRNGREITVELRSVNSRYFEYSSRMPRTCSYLDSRLKKQLNERVTRGKVELSLTVQTVDAADTVVAVNQELAKSYQQALRDQVLADAADRRERIAVAAGGAEETVDELIARAKALNHERVVLVAPGGVDKSGENTDGLGVAAAVAGAIAGESDPAVPLGGAVLTGLYGLSGRYNDGEMDRLILGGVTPVESLAGTMVVVRGVTTRTTTGEAADATWRDLTTIRIVHNGIPTVDGCMRAKFQRAKNTAQSRGAIRAQVVLELENKKAREIITGYENVTVTADSQDPARCLVDFSFTVAHGLNQIWLTAHITV